MTVETRMYEMKTIQGDMLTPISIYHALNGKKKMLFESSAKHEESGRYSFIAINPIAEMVASKNDYQLFNNEHELVIHGANAFHKLKSLLPTENAKLPFSFFGGAIGYFGYETAFYHEKIGDILKDNLHMPDMHVLFYDTFIVVDHLMQNVHIVAVDLLKKGHSQQELRKRINDIEKQLKTTILTQAEDDSDTIQFRSTIEKEEFCEMVKQAKQHIEQGDIFQVVLSQRFEADFTGNPMNLYRRLRTTNPSPYMFYMDFEEYVILGTSPESLVKVEGRVVTTNPIAGTRRRGYSEQEDESLEQELLQDEKELAEHRMLVDLGRNDIGKLSKVGSVKLPKFMQIERYKHVMHIVSEVTGELKDDIHPLDVLATALPAGTVSGAPKIRAMQIINDLEHDKRGVYAGAVGYVSITGDMDMALAIRTMVITKGKAYVQAGAGIVYHSDPEKEYEETLNKAKALLEVRA
ncbi:anthranilate synthase component I [Rummeliibacillus sp. NPDC094406]|uniref:anthranilate synthase component I n=1 Tax=Rummeliibacillus sp. NPDC094406 TaxID=3364511 RepID=UPI003803CE99